MRLWMSYAAMRSDNLSVWPYCMKRIVESNFVLDPRWMRVGDQYKVIRTQVLVVLGL